MAKRILKILGWIAGAVVALLLILVVFVNARWDAADSRTAPEIKAPADSATIARGEYIFKYQAQCWGCHQDAPSDPTGPPAGGMLFDLSNAGPGFGKWYSRNITPDVETGIGGWTDGEIVQALREGVRKDRSPLFPIMPIDWYNRMADEDVLALVAYMRSLQPVRNEVPDREPSLVAKALFTFGMIKPKEPVTAAVTAPPRGVTPEYGRYLSSNLADCADCHTPRNLQDGQFYMDSLFAGSSFAFGEEGANWLVASYARNITPDIETGIGSWTEQHFIDAVTAGMRPDSTVLTPHMPYAYYKFWSEDDLRAMFVYLKTIPTLKRTVPATAHSIGLQARGVERGGMLFRARCQTCHGENGRGALATNVKLAEVAPSLTGAELMEFIASGQMNLKMPPFGKTLTGEELNDVVAFIRTWEQGEPATAENGK